MSRRQRRKHELAVINESDLTDEEVWRGINAVNRQVTEDYSPHWGGRLHLELDPRPEGLDYALRIRNESTLEDAAGHHTINTTRAQFGRVLGEVALNTGFEWTVILSHEVLEMLANPSVNKYAIDWHTGLITPMEICDPVQATAYDIDGVLVSDFVLPTYYESDIRHRDCAFHTRGVRPFAVPEGGYAIRFNQNWEEVSVFNHTDVTVGHYRAEQARLMAQYTANAMRGWGEEE